MCTFYNNKNKFKIHFMLQGLLIWIIIYFSTIDVFILNSNISNYHTKLMANRFYTDSIVLNADSSYPKDFPWCVKYRSTT